MVATSNSVTDSASNEPDLSALPRNVDKKTGAQLIKQFYFPVSDRSLERWPVGWRKVNGWNVTPTAELLAEAKRRFEDAPVIMRGRRAETGRAA